MNFGVSPDGSAMGPNDLAITGTISIDLSTLAPGGTAELQGEVEIGADRNAAVQLVLSDRGEGFTRVRNSRVTLAEPGSAGHKAFRAGIEEYLSLFPPNSQGEANPADKDPVPLPFDSTYNTPEHDAFVLKVKYQRTDAFLTDSMLEGRSARA